MPKLCLRQLAPDEPSNWPEALARSATFTGLDAWLNIAHRLYRFPSYRFEAKRRDTSPHSSR